MQDAADLFSAIVFLNLAVALRDGPQSGWALFRPRLHQHLANFSFSLYSVHVPVLILSLAVAERFYGAGWARELATPRHWATMGVAMSVAILTGYAFSLVTEAHTGAARRAIRTALQRLERRWGPAPPPAPKTDEAAATREPEKAGV